MDRMALVSDQLCDYITIELHVQKTLLSSCMWYSRQQESNRSGDDAFARHPGLLQHPMSAEY